MPTLHTEKGFRFFFYSDEGNEPPHIHVVGHGGEMKVWLKTIDVDKIFRLSPKKQKIVVKIIKENRTYFLEEWRKYHE